MEKGVSFPLDVEADLMSKQRKHYSVQFKFQLALEAAQGRRTLNELGMVQKRASAGNSRHSGIVPTLRADGFISPRRGAADQLRRIF